MKLTPHGTPHAGGGNLGTLQLFSVEDVLNHPAAVAGYHHRLAGEDFHPMYETCNPGEQKCYELGRAMAVIFGPGAYYACINKELAVTAQALSRMCRATAVGDAHPTLLAEQRSDPARYAAKSALPARDR